MNHTLQTYLAWFGAINALGYLCTGAWITAVSIAEARRLHAKRDNLRARRAPLTEAALTNVDFDAELAQLTKENDR